MTLERAKVAPPRGSMCVDCFKIGKDSCPMREVHPLAYACEQFTRRVTDFRFVLGAEVDPETVRVTVNGEIVQVEYEYETPQSTHMPTAGAGVNSSGCKDWKVREV